MPRIPRGQVAGHAYHVLNRGNGGTTVFHGRRLHRISRLAHLGENQIPRQDLRPLPHAQSFSSARTTGHRRRLEPFYAVVDEEHMP
jgi:hypothetical protein